MRTNISIALLDNYQQIALQYADWTNIQSKAKVTVFYDHLSNENEVISRLKLFTIICVMRERTPLTRSILSQLPNLKVIISTGANFGPIGEPAVTVRKGNGFTVN